MVGWLVGRWLVGGWVVFVVSCDVAGGKVVCRVGIQPLRTVPHCACARVRVGGPIEWVGRCGERGERFCFVCAHTCVWCALHERGRVYPFYSSSRQTRAEDSWNPKQYVMEVGVSGSFHEVVGEETKTVVEARYFDGIGRTTRAAKFKAATMALVNLRENAPGAKCVRPSFVRTLATFHNPNRRRGVVDLRRPAPAAPGGGLIPGVEMRLRFFMADADALAWSFFSSALAFSASILACATNKQTNEKDDDGRTDGK